MVKSAEGNSTKRGDWAIGISGIPAIILILLISSGVGYAMYTHGIAEVLRTSFILSFPISVGVLGFSVYSSHSYRHAWYGWRGIKSVILIFMFSFIFFLILFGLGLCLTELISMVWLRIANNLQFSLVVGFFTLVSGGLLFGARLKWRATYGLSEVVAGVLIASHRAYGEHELWSSTNSDFYLAILAGGIYLVVRGLDNFYQGRELQNDPAIRLINWIKAKIIITDPDELKKMYGE
jgi:hypothetical protein